MRLIIAGGRDFLDYGLLKGKLDKLLSNISYSEVTLICGKARGADTLGEKWAKDNNIPVEYFVPDWDGLGKKAGHVRNARMADEGTHLVAFWDRSSKGTKNMLYEAQKRGLDVRICYY